MLVAIALVSVTLLAGVGVCGMTTCSMMTVRDTCPHGPALHELRVRAVTAQDDGTVAVRLEGKRLQGLSDAYLYAATAEAAAGISAEVEAGTNTIVVRVAEPPAAGASRPVEVTLTFGCRREVLGCGHPGRGDTHRLTVGFSLVAQADGWAATELVATDEFTAPTGPGAP